MVAGEGFEPSKAKPTDLQNGPRSALTRGYADAGSVQGTNRGSPVHRSHSRCVLTADLRFGTQRLGACRGCGCQSRSSSAGLGGRSERMSPALDYKDPVGARDRLRELRALSGEYQTLREAQALLVRHDREECR